MDDERVDGIMAAIEAFGRGRFAEGRHTAELEQTDRTRRRIRRMIEAALAQPVRPEAGTPGGGGLAAVRREARAVAALIAAGDDLDRIKREYERVAPGNAPIIADWVWGALRAALADPALADLRRALEDER